MKKLKLYLSLLIFTSIFLFSCSKSISYTSQLSETSLTSEIESLEFNIAKNRFLLEDSSAIVRDGVIEVNLLILFEDMCSNAEQVLRPELVVSKKYEADVTAFDRKKIKSGETTEFEVVLTDRASGEQLIETVKVYCSIRDGIELEPVKHEKDYGIDDLVVLNDNLLLTQNDRFFYLFDYSNPDDLKLLSKTELPEYDFPNFLINLNLKRKTYLKKNLLIFSAGYYVFIYDIKNPKKPVLKDYLKAEFTGLEDNSSRSDVALYVDDDNNLLFSSIPGSTKLYHIKSNGKTEFIKNLEIASGQPVVYKNKLLNIHLKGFTVYEIDQNFNLKKIFNIQGDNYRIKDWHIYKNNLIFQNYNNVKQEIIFNLNTLDYSIREIQRDNHYREINNSLYFWDIIHDKYPPGKFAKHLLAQDSSMPESYSKFFGFFSRFDSVDNLLFYCKNGENAFNIYEAGKDLNLINNYVFSSNTDYILEYSDFKFVANKSCFDVYKKGGKQIVDKILTDSRIMFYGPHDKLPYVCEYTYHFNYEEDMNHPQWYERTEMTYKIRKILSIENKIVYSKPYIFDCSYGKAFYTDSKGFLIVDNEILSYKNNEWVKEPDKIFIEPDILGYFDSNFYYLKGQDFCRGKIVDGKFKQLEKIHTFKNKIRYGSNGYFSPYIYFDEENGFVTLQKQLFLIKYDGQQTSFKKIMDNVQISHSFGPYYILASEPYSIDAFDKLILLHKKTLDVQTLYIPDILDIVYGNPIDFSKYFYAGKLRLEDNFCSSYELKEKL